ncbi:MAG: ferrochelatase [Elusimicrobia bacterium]|nr:ferrochelatase [Candidatus Obscuribacterium magneticum]
MFSQEHSRGPLPQKEGIRRAVLLLNMGGPEKLSDVRPFLFRLFSDPSILPIKNSVLRKAAAWGLAALRTKASAERYKMIGGASPLRRLTEEQAQALEKSLNEQDQGVRVRAAFSYSEPFIEAVVEKLASEGVHHYLSLPLYPQYSRTTSGSSLEGVRRAVKKYCPGGRLEEIPSYPTHPLFIQAHVERIRDELKKFTIPLSKNIYLLYSAHSIPEKVAAEGDPYPSDVHQTVMAIMERLEWEGDLSLAWQSKVGPVRWIGPDTSEVVQRLGIRGVKQLLVVPVSFVSDHLETLSDMDRFLAKVAAQSGIVEFRRAPALNSHPSFIQALADLALGNRRFWE